MKNTKKGVCLVLLGASLWATLPAFSRFIYASGGDPISAAAIRAYLAASVFLVWFIANGTLKKLKLRELPFYLLYGTAGIVGTFLFYMLAVEMISTAMAAVLLYTAPAFVIILSRIFYKDPITPAKIAALICTFIGCALVVRLYDFSSFSANIIGILIGLASGLAYSMVTVLGSKANRMHDTRTNAGLMTIFGALVFMFIKPPTQIPTPVPQIWIGYAGIALFGSVFAYLAYLKGFQYLQDGGIASITASVEPVLATLICAALYHDSLEVLQIIGVVVVLVGISVPILYQKYADSAAHDKDYGIVISPDFTNRTSELSDVSEAIADDTKDTATSAIGRIR